MTPEHRTKILLARTSNYYDIMRTTMFVFAVVAAVIHLGPGTYSSGLVMLVIANTAYGVLAGGSALDDMIALRSDMDDDMSATVYGKAIKARNLPGLKMSSSVLVGLVGVAELLEILI
jgi:hypothetical protein